MAGATLTGAVISDVQRPVEFATVLLFDRQDSVTVVRTTATDTLGRYTFAGVKPGQYVMRVKMIGFTPKSSQTILVTPGSSVVATGVISLPTQSQHLQGVTVEGERPFAERSLGKVTLNVANPFFKTATNALEVLRRAPGVIVDPTGAITLNGTVTPVVYLEGRQLPLSPEEIRSLPSEDIEQIELMSNASARYDGETRAVVNIKLKRDKTLGLKGSAYAGGSLNRRYAGYEAGISATYKTKRWAYYGRVGYSELNNFLRNSSLRVVLDDKGDRTTFDQYTFIHTRPRPLSYQAVADYSLNKKHTLSLLIKGLVRPERDVTTNTNDVTITTPPATTTETYQIPSATVSNLDLTSVAIDLSYRGTLNAKGDELQAYVDYAYYDTQQDQVFRTFFPTRASNTLRFPAVLRGQFPNTTQISSLRVDYTHVMSQVVKLSLGGKLNQTNTDNTLNYDTASTMEQEVYFADASRSNRFTYDETIAAGYGGVTVDKGATTLETALRVEYTHSVGNSQTLSSVVQRSYYRWLPNVQLQHKFDKQRVLSLTYARKMRRPSFYDLNPFQFYISPYEYNEGNPFLLPVTISSTEASYTHKDITLTGNYTLRRDQMAQLPVQDPESKVIRFTRANLDRVRNVSLTVSSPTVINKWWRMQHSLVFYHTKTRSPFDDNTIRVQAWSGYLNGQQTFTLPGKTTLELLYDFKAPSAGQIYRTRSSGTINLSLQKALLNGKANLQVYAADLFNTYREAFYGKYNGIDINTFQTRNVQELSARFTYRFGSSTFSRVGRASGSAEEENRANR